MNNEYHDWTGTVIRKDGTSYDHALSLVRGGEAEALTHLRAIHQQSVDVGFEKPADKFAVREPSAKDYQEMSF